MLIWAAGSHLHVVPPAWGVAPQVAFNASGQAMAVWTRDPGAGMIDRQVGYAT